MKNQNLKIILIIIAIVFCEIGFRLCIPYFAEFLITNPVSKNIFQLIYSQAVLGKTDNNEYEIRNDVYDYIQSDILINKDLTIQEKSFILNLAHIEQKLLEYSLDNNKDMILKYLNTREQILACSEKDDYFTNPKSKYNKTFINTKERLKAKKKYEEIY